MLSSDQAAQGFIQSCLEKLQGWRLPNLSGQRVPVINYPHSEFFFPYKSVYSQSQNIMQHCFIFSFISLISKSFSLWSPSFPDFSAWHYKDHHWYHQLYSTSDPRWCSCQYLFLRVFLPSGKVHNFKPARCLEICQTTSTDLSLSHHFGRPFTHSYYFNTRPRSAVWPQLCFTKEKVARLWVTAHKLKPSKIYKKSRNEDRSEIVESVAVTQGLKEKILTEKVLKPREKKSK